MSFDDVHSQLLPQLLQIHPTPPPQLHVLIHFFYNGPLTPMCVAHILLSVGSFTGTLLTSEEPYPKMSFPYSKSHQLPTALQLRVAALEPFPA